MEKCSYFCFSRQLVWVDWDPKFQLAFCGCDSNTSSVSKPLQCYWDPSCSPASQWTVLHVVCLLSVSSVLRVFVFWAGSDPWGWAQKFINNYIVVWASSFLWSPWYSLFPQGLLQVLGTKAGTLVPCASCALQQLCTSAAKHTTAGQKGMRGGGGLCSPYCLTITACY